MIFGENGKGALRPLSHDLVSIEDDVVVLATPEGEHGSVTASILPVRDDHEQRRAIHQTGFRERLDQVLLGLVGVDIIEVVEEVRHLGSSFD